MLAYLLDQNGSISIQNVPEPSPAEQNAILKVKSASICGTDFRTFMHGNTKIDPPRILGHESAGEIVHAGAFAKAHGIEPGQRVTVAPAIGCGECWPCKTGHTNMCDNLTTLGFQYEGAFAEYMEIPMQAIKMGNVLPIPENVDYDDAVLAEPAACGLNAQSYLHITKGDYVVIYGSGFIGCVHAELAKLAGADKVIMVEIAAPRREIAEQMVPGIEIIDPVAENTAEQISRLTGKRGANVVITALSVPQIHTEALEVASKMGRISLFGGIPGDGKGYLDSNLIHYKELCVYGAHATPPSMIKDLLNRVAAGNMNLKKYITKKLPLTEIESGFIALRDENAMKIVLNP
ncbi:MAG: alcohol dehydrogenase catalytic domain-containing protein [Oscillospiraceae bacterium]|nr:alcohol dehydrogenase catalytic domain-containing protein [Oscillospiraceae bacterium]MCL2277825.1 alcohol dehydrogenase catalytic domain-containing protein [Oscillospiraceae bacterium]